MLMAASIFIPFCLGENFPVGFGAVLSCRSPVPSFLKARHLGAGWFRGISGGLLLRPFSIG